MEKCLRAILELKGIGELKSAVKKLHLFLKNRDALSMTDVALPNYLWTAKRGGGVTTLVKAFTEYLYAARAIEFCGRVKSFEFKLNYVAPDSFFSELARLDNSFFDHAGHHHRYKGVVCINIDEWLEHTNEVHFVNFLDYIARNNDRLLVIFCTYTDNKKFVETVEMALAAHVRFETQSLEFPGVPELVEFVESRLESKGFSLTEGVKALLNESVEKISVARNFSGFRSVEQLANEISYYILANDLNNGKQMQITADMIACFNKNSLYVGHLTKPQISMKKQIGFTFNAERST
ncbi:MAG: hypothetical protein LBH22_06720 [Bacteroidales bacterium]|nr:hypothetical protein [Bacteroidales bacterium]